MIDPISYLDSGDDEGEGFDGDEYEAYIRRSISEHKYVNFDYGVAGKNVLVGHEAVRKTERCDHFTGWKVCLNVEGHELVLALVGKPDRIKGSLSLLFIIVLIGVVGHV